MFVLQWLRVKQIRWNLVKNAELRAKRGVSFEEIIQAKLVAILKHPQRTHQKIMLFEFKNYIWVVPYVDTDGEVFLKTLFPSRKFTKLWKDKKL